MMLDALDYKSSISKNKVVISDPFKLKKLVQEMQETLFIDDDNDSNLVQYFGNLDNRKHNPFGYDVKKEEQLKINQYVYRRNRLRHKLIRIRNEFKFVKENSKYFRELTRREKQIMQLLARGSNNPQIAEQFCISRHTVEQHRKHINYKLKIESFPHLMHYSYAFDLI